ncbi:deoxyribose-phosphate aldolase [Alicyclobacillus herbarius]|uniref:deoxyribose-phosphate aldolase n=1 Tax=Alicyclobacillus herbarius TaxID=122960 RepID=UPI0003F8889E|nr:deoxyribose-phosphate aldolase [Alicyclobacillus herbarius]
MANEAVERAAGGLVVREGRRGREVLMIDDAYGHVAFPKGHLEPGERWEDAAVREIAEETGIAARILGPLGRVEYRIEREGRPIRKQVRLFLLSPVDSSAEPVHQAEEVQGARYLPWDEAVKAHSERGYANWSWVLDKADVFYTWYRDNWESWRQTPADLSLERLSELWDQGAAHVARVLAVTRKELEATTDWGASLPEPLPLRLPLPIDRPADQVRGALEHTLLRPEASQVDVERVLAEAVRLRCAAVCIHPQHVSLAAQRVAGSPTKVCTVVGFPFGAENPDVLADEVHRAAAAGADEVDMVIPIGSMCEDDVWTVYRHVQSVVEAARSHPGVRVKAILETHYLALDQVVKAGYAALMAGSDFLKTSTGFAPTGARWVDVAVMAQMAGLAANGDRGVKAAGGIRTHAQALTFLRMGASRIGASSGPALIGD